MKKRKSIPSSEVFKQLDERHRRARRALLSHQFMKIPSALIDYSILSIFEQGYQAGLDAAKRKPRAEGGKGKK